MMKTKKLTSTLAAALLALAAHAQTDMTSAIVNPEFDGRSFAGWQQQGMQFQTNNSFSGKSLYAYVERWVSNTGNLPDTYIQQTISGLTPGRYTLTVAAQSIKQESSAAATGAAIFADWQETAVTTTADYSLTFDVLTGEVTIGFRCKNSTANWMACDNFRLTQVSTSVSYLRSGLSTLVNTANTLASQSMDAAAKSALSSAITAARSLTSNGTAANIKTAATTLKNAMKAAERSIFATKTSTTGSVPTVVTDMRYARGATKIFGRSTINSSATILEQGFCYSTTSATPTVADERTTRYVENGGRIYCLDDLQPGTLYYIRAYAVTTDYRVGYGDVIKVYTLPKGDVRWVFNQNDADELQQARISNAVMGVANYWTNLTSITGFTATANYASGTPTADCSYGGWIRVGSNESYQAHGTLAHEILHGIGVGTHSTYIGDIRENNTRGIWRGKRATRFLQFWDNSDGARLTGDQTHFWATGVKQSLSYTINGANEDNHSDASYYGNSLLAQAVVEDGLAPVGGNLQGLAYTLDSDGKTFFIRNSDENYGLKSDYLVDNNGTLQLRTLSGDEARQAGNNAHWQLTFDPAKQTYRIKNKQTGRYIYYASDNTNNGFRAATSTTNEVDLRLQLSFVDVTIGKGSTTRTLDGYHIMRATSTPSPQAFCAKSATATGSTAFSNTFAATAQRWVFIDVDDLNDIDDIISAGERYDLDELIANIRNLAGKSHTQKVSTANTTLENTLKDIEVAEQTADGATIVALKADAKKAMMTFLQNTTPTGDPYDLTFLIKNAGMDDTQGWQGTEPTLSYSCGEFYQKAFDVYQTVSGAPAGRYVFKLQAFQRPGSSADTYADFTAGTTTFPITSQVYLATSYELAKHIATEAGTTMVGIGAESEVGSPTRYMPNNMEAAQAYFTLGRYENTVETTLTGNNQTLRFGIRGASYVSSDWTIFDNFRLYYYGQSTETQDPAADITGFDITNAMAPYLSTGSLKDWQNDGMNTNYTNGSAPYNNSADGARIDFPFIERWVASGSKLDDTHLQQTITELPNGTYYLRASIIACQQAQSGVDVSGAKFFAADKTIDVATENGIPEQYSLRVDVTDGTLTFGLRTSQTTANWIAIDNIQLIFDGSEDEYYALATPCQPVRVPIANPTFDNNTTEGWTLNESWGIMNTTYDHFNPPFAEHWEKSKAMTDRAITQTVNLRAGAYSLTAAVEAVRQDQPSTTVNGVTLRLDDEAISCHTADIAPEIFTIENTLKAGDHTFGLYIENTQANWVAVDNFVLRYYGTAHVQKGDVNQDGQISIADVTALVNILTASSTSLTANFTSPVCVADVNGDGVVSVADVKALVSILLSTTGAQK